MISSCCEKVKQFIGFELRLRIDELLRIKDLMSGELWNGRVKLK